MAADAARTDAGGRRPSGGSALRPFRYPAFAVIWTASVLANIGTWMYSAGSGWLMTGLNPDPLIVSLVQVAAGLPIFLVAIPAGAVADIVERRHLLIYGEIANTLIATIFAALVALHLVTPTILLVFTFLIGAFGALTAPAWQAVTPQLVPKQDLQAAIAANSIGFNLARAIGPALGGALTAVLGITAPFWVNAASNLGINAGLVWWRPPRRAVSRLPAERFAPAIRTGLRYARHNSHLRATLLRAVAFFVFASAYWALLPLLTRSQIAAGPEVYGLLLGAIGAGAIAGSFALPYAKAQLGADRLVAAGTIGTALALVLFALARDTATALVASILAGAAWIAVLSTLNVSAQVALPEWVRARGLALFMTVYFGAHTAGSALWGQVAAWWGLPLANLIAAAGIVIAIPLTWRWHLQTGVDIDLAPSMHWAAPIVSGAIEEDRGPVLVMVEYRIDPARRDAFLAAIERLGQERRRDGAYRWGVFEDAADPACMVETFLVESWLEHLRQHERVTNADRVMQAEVQHFNVDGEPKVTHLIAAELA
ncbi:MAG TPA: MFS transporter [Xanthobacteraceae bacterium]|nr:MFS transporter [Xanthobacteraceae bacterium]